MEELRVLGELKLDETGKRSKCKKRLAAFFASLGNHLEIELTIYAKSSSMGLQAAVNVVKSAVNAFNEKHGVEGAKAAYTKVPADVDEMLETLYKNADAGATTGFSEAYDIKVLLQVRAPSPPGNLHRIPSDDRHFDLSIQAWASLRLVHLFISDSLAS